MKQAVAGCFGLLSVAVSIGFWVLPGAFFTEDVAVFKWVASVLACVFGVFLLWYASAGQDFEIQVDLTKGELRMAARNAKGQARVLQRFRFWEIDRLEMQPVPGEGEEAVLVLRLTETGETIDVLQAPENQLYALKNRMSKDVSNAAVIMRRDSKVRARQVESDPHQPGPETQAACLLA